MEFATRAVHGGAAASEAAGDVIPPLHLTTIYAFEEPGVTRAGYSYIRTGNPTRHALEACVASLENAPPDAPALCFSSGMAAVDCATRLLRPGDRLVICRDVYGGTFALATEILECSGIEVVYADATSPAAFAAAITPATRMVWTETPSNPLLRITDLRSVAEAAHAAGAILVTDSTFATPFFQNPLDHGADVVMHSMTKYLGGHSDLLGGVLVARDPSLRERLYAVQKVTGAVAAPFDCFLALRGIRTLPVRMAQHERNAFAVARYLTGHSRVTAVHYPGLDTHPQHDLAVRQMRGFGGVVSFEVDGGGDPAMAVLKAAKLFAHAGSLGGVESIITYPAMTSHAAMSPEDRLRRGVTPGLIRLSMGLEDAADLISDLDQALRAGAGG